MRVFLLIIAGIGYAWSIVVAAIGLLTFPYALSKSDPGEKDYGWIAATEFLCFCVAIGSVGWVLAWMASKKARALQQRHRTRGFEVGPPKAE